MKSFARPMTKSFWRITVPRLPISSSTTPFQASRPASVTTNDGTPILVMIRPCSVPIPRPAREHDHDRQRRRQLVAVGREQQRGEHAADAGHEADREVDLAEQQGERDAHGDHRVRRRLDDQVDEVPRREEAVVLGLEDDRDDDQADDDRQRAEVAGLDAGPPAAGVARRRCRARRLGGGRGAATVLTPPPPAAGHLGQLAGGDRLDDLLLLVSVRLNSATFWPSRRTVMLSATSKMSCRLCEMRITARPCSPSRLTRSSTCASGRRRARRSARRG